ncbi:unnamed protein product [Acanthoscelides obtectus]|uniref:Uncharacterized protein n=1 Tax=Acanthoscelides obtectus TaxID=200917 RepID=A0A9P0JTC7_ACAOB|nr:unnamed protein product [Acanthoscelides obtectus]CAK1640763.1 hypothetical protein AOBTE_LOCUS11919 [Acanthoscelides obtectus]
MSSNTPQWKRQSSRQLAENSAYRADGFSGETLSWYPRGRP